MKKSFTFDIHGFQVRVKLNAMQAEKLAAMIPLKREWDALRGFSTPDVLYTADAVLHFVVYCAFRDEHTLDEALMSEIDYHRKAIAMEKAKRAKKDGGT